MNISEQEARSKWCPFTRISEEDGGSVNRLAYAEGSFSGCKCIASGCMLWRKVDKNTGYCGLSHSSRQGGKQS